MHRSVWIGLAAILATGLLGALLLGRALEKTKHRQSFVPAGAKIIETRALRGPPGQRVVTWRLGGQAEDVSSGLYGVTIWEGKRPVYAHRARLGAEGMRVETGDFTGDGRDDVLLFDATDGSGGCGVYRALAATAGGVHLAKARLLCEDAGSIHLRRGGLLLSLGVTRDPKTRQQTHCCYLFVKRILERWDGRRMKVVSSTLERLGRNQWPPGGFPPGGQA